MENKFHGLPPLKRFRLMQQEKPTENPHHIDFQASSCLPAKKRKESRDPPLLANDSASLTTSAATTYCLPAKKRIFALHPDLLTEKSISPFDLNLDYNPEVDEQDGFVAKGVQSSQIDELDNQISERDETEVDEDDDGILCAVCQSTDGDPSDPIVFCDGCDLMVHTTCYGHPLTKGVPEGDWFCSQCLISGKKAKATLCCLCHVKGGALKHTTDGRWAHIVCALFVPEVFFNDPEGREGVDCSKVPSRRWGKRCYVCKGSDGCAVDCSEPKCCLSFHVTCGVKEDLCIEYKEGKNKGAIVAGFCKSHSDLWIKQQTTGKYKIVARDEKEDK